MQVLTPFAHSNKLICNYYHCFPFTYCVIVAQNNAHLLRLHLPAAQLLEQNCRRMASRSSHLQLRLGRDACRCLVNAVVNCRLRSFAANAKRLLRFNHKRELRFCLVWKVEMFWSFLDESSLIKYFRSIKQISITIKSINHVKRSRTLPILCHNFHQVQTHKLPTYSKLFLPFKQ